MNTLRAENGSLYLYCKPIRTIHFYNDTGVIHSASSTIYNENNEAVDRLEVLQILQTDKTFKKEETEQEFVKKQMKKHINFSYVVKKRYSWKRYSWADDELIVYLYVDDEYIKVIDQKDRTEISLYDYSLSRGYTYINDITLEIDGKIVKHSENRNYEEKPDETLIAQAKAVFEKVNKFTYIKEGEFNRIFNRFELVERKEPLLKKDEV